MNNPAGCPPSAAHPLRLYKREKLCSLTAIDMLFAAASSRSGNSALSYPVRMIWRRNEGCSAGASVRFLISVPKKRLRHAVDRVTMRRRIREAYRLNRDLVQVADGACHDIAFVYVANGLEPYARVEKAIRRLLASFSAGVAEPIPATDETLTT